MAAQNVVTQQVCVCRSNDGEKGPPPVHAGLGDVAVPTVMQLHGLPVLRPHTLMYIAHKDDVGSDKLYRNWKDPADQ